MKKPSGILCEDNGNFSSMRLMGLFYSIAFFGNAIFTLYMNAHRETLNPNGVYVGMIFLLAATLGKSLQKLLEQKNAPPISDRKRANFLQEDNCNYSYTRLQSLGLCFFSIILGTLVNYYGGTLADFQSDGIIFVMLATLGAICPKLLQKLIEENYEEIVDYAQDKLKN